VRAQFVVAVLLTLMFASIGLRAADGLEIGVWNLDPSKSVYSSAPPKGEHLMIAPDGPNGIKLRAEITDATGKLVVAEYSGQYDGKDVPITGAADADTVALKRISPYKTERIYKKAGKVTTIMMRVVSKDGKTQSNTTTGTNVKGEKVRQVAFFVKQQ
jgi:hypothetical protein